MDATLAAPRPARGLLALGSLLALGLSLVSVAPLRADDPSPSELARVAWNRSTSASRRVARMLDMARRVGDVRQTMCLDDALSRIDSQVRLVEDRAERIRRAEAAHDSPTAAREARLLATVLHLLPQTERVADACVGVIRDQTTVEVEVPPELGTRTEL